MISGVLEAIDAYHASGWSYDPEHPNWHLSVEARLGARTVGEAVANIHRSDLQLNGIGDGDHGFACTLALNGRLTPEVADALIVRVRHPDGSSLDLKLETPAPPAIKSHWQPSDASQNPVFIMGSQRSGTSAMTVALLQTKRYRGQSEGELLDLLYPLSGAVDAFFDDKEEWFTYNDTMFRLVPRHYFRDGLRHVFVDVVRQLFGYGHWIDKTPSPEMIHLAPSLRELWPSSRFIFMKRRGIENVLSRRRKFPGQSFEHACTEWARAMKAWRTVRDSLVGVAAEVDQVLLGRDPGAVANTLGRFLHLTGVETGTMAQSLLATWPERTSHGPQVVRGLSETGWHTDGCDMFKKTCDAEMSQFGYSYDGDYYSPGQASKELVMV